MKLKEGFLLREIAGETVVLPAGDDLDLNMMITLNGTAKFLWEQLQEEIAEDALVEKLLAEYEIDAQGAKVHVHEFVEKLNEYGFLA